MSNIRQNLFFAFIYNAASAPITACALYPLFRVHLSSIIAAAVTAFSSVSVIGNALRLEGVKRLRHEYRSGHVHRLASGLAPF